MRHLISAFTLSLCALPLIGHDLWLHSVADPNHDSKIELRLSIGEALTPESRVDAADMKNVERFELHSSEESRDLHQELYWRDNASIALTSPGTNLIVMERAPVPIELDRETFIHYVEEEGRGELVDLLPSGRSKVSERFSRHLKTMVSRTARRDLVWNRRTQLRLEIVPLDDPFARTPGESLRVLLLFEDDPLASTPVFIHGRNGTAIFSDQARTDENGTAVLAVPEGVDFLIRSVHIRPATGSDEFDFESFWTSLTWTNER
ncbi:MAG: DUF4198 domain-containing protein [Thermoanaerobaculia bacterium]|nr:DUF4198 domain-containing protein [Thermoanaerobaculia bacterium]